MTEKFGCYAQREDASASFLLFVVFARSVRRSRKTGGGFLRPFMFLSLLGYGLYRGYAI